MKKLNLGCGRDIKKSNKEEIWINLDQFKLKGVDVAHNLDKTPWPFKSNYFDEIYARDVIEHLKDLFKTMKEIHRISKKNGRFYISHHLMCVC